MILINSQFLKVVENGVEQRVKQRLNVFERLNPTADLIWLNSGDVVRPLSDSVIEAMQRSVVEMSDRTTFKGRGPSSGYPFLIEAIIKNEYKRRKVKLDAEDIFINTGTKDDLSGIGDILCRDIRIAVANPTYQTYVESNVITKRAGEWDEVLGGWSHLIYLEGGAESDFMAQLPEVRPDVIYLNSPCDPTGCVMSRQELEKWVKYAVKNDALILFDATYAPFVSDPDTPRSIYEIRGARKVAIEFRSFSKSGGFTGMHCGWVVIPREISGYSFSCDRSESLNALWRRRLDIKSYPPSYIVQRGAEALYSEAGAAQTRQNIEYYMKNASILLEGLSHTRLRYWGGKNSPFIWVEAPGHDSWAFCGLLLERCHIVASMGERFGSGGMGYVRLSAFADQTDIIRASTRLADLDI